ncbi:breast cancer anti-estrogen resistance protein 1 isoform X1 [Anopheles bellator]|uniref:breast cancer anti-estrogen resistance protein 1 isoform X1 n=1 Tax=Anopheles bellator TaxID=139047 RepID=UPI00264791CE|nr:breast cancer anti-estrogen resistance protein 1 isoform X1 [Anopheles bellator]
MDPPSLTTGSVFPVRPSLDHLLAMADDLEEPCQEEGQGPGTDDNRTTEGDNLTDTVPPVADGEEGEEEEPSEMTEPQEQPEVQQPPGAGSNQKLLAKATYDNIAESTDELAFRKGEILTVIETDTNGLKGWWLCQLRGRQGICPGNRLKIVQSHDSGCFTLSPASSPCPTIDSTTNLNSPIPSEIYENTSLSGLSIGSQRQGKRRSWHIMPNKVLTPQKCGDVYLYDLLPPSSTRGSSPYQHSLQHQTSSSDGLETYDVPKPAIPVASFDPHQQQAHRTSWIRTPTGGHHYGAPHASQLLLHHQSIHSSNSSSSLSFHHHLQHQYPHLGSPHIQTGGYRMEESYDVPRPLLSQQQHLTPSSSNSSLLMSESFSLSSSNRSSLANMPDYDVPRRHPVSVRSTPPPPSGMGAPGVPTPGTPLSASFTTSQHSMSMSSFSSMSTYDVPPAQQQPAFAGVTNNNTNFLSSKGHQLLAHQQSPKELPLELSSALETLARLQNEATTAVTRLLSFVSPNWRVKEKLDPILMDLKLAAVRLRTALHDLAEFGDGALGNATKAEDKGLAHKLKPLVKALRDADKLVHEASQNLDGQGWTLVTLQRPEATQKLQQQLPPDSLDQLIACAQTLTEDVRQTASFIQGNATLLFKRSPPTPPTSCPTTPLTPTGGAKPPSSGASGGGEWPEDYDYVSLESKEASAKTNAEIRDALPQDLKKNFENVVRNAADAAAAACAEKPEALDPNDKSVLVYYASQTVTHMGYLTQAIDAFLQTVEHNQPPKFFLAYGKFVVLSAHNLVNIGDIVHRNVSREAIKTRVLACADALSEALKTCVGKTKKAAQNFPSVTAVQEMVDSVVDISHLASDLKIAMLDAVQQ